MQPLLPGIETAAILNRQKVFFYFLKLKRTDNDGAALKQQFTQHQAKCLHWFQCEYLLIGEETDSLWTHAAIIEFPSFKAVKKAINKRIESEEVEALQVFTVQATSVPKFILFFFTLLRPIGILFLRFSKKITVDQVMRTFPKERKIQPTRAQVIRHLANTRTSKVYMINLLQSYPLAQYDDNRKPGLSGSIAYYHRYGLPALRSIIMTKGNLFFGGRMGHSILEINAPKATQGNWEAIGIIEYESPAKLFSLIKMPGYKRSLAHRKAGLERTALIIAK